MQLFLRCLVLRMLMHFDYDFIVGKDFTWPNRTKIRFSYGFSCRSPRTNFPGNSFNTFEGETCGWTETGGDTQASHYVLHTMYIREKNVPPCPSHTESLLLALNVLVQMVHP
jgi:hypothetical protein